MKKTVLTIAIALILLVPLWGQTEADFTVRSFQDGVIITGYTGTLRIIRIPATIAGLPVRGITGFRNRSISSVTIPNSVTTIGENAFRDNILTSVTIPNSVTRIDASAFENNQIRNITIPNNVTFIGNSAFSNNPLTSITIGANVRHFGSSYLPCHIHNYFNVFYERNGRQPGIYTYANERWHSDSISAAAPSAPAPSAATTIRAGAFQERGLTSYTIPDNITTIGNRAFAQNQLTSIVIPNNVVTIGNLAFSSNRLTSVTIGNSVTTIGNGAFWGNPLTSITIPDSVTTIGNEAFYANRLTNVTIGNGVTSIGNRAFYGAVLLAEGSRLTSITIPDSVTTIGNSAFALNPITSITIGANVQMPNNAFPNRFVAFYNSNGRQADTYTFANGRWQRSPIDLVIPDGTTTIENAAYRNRPLSSLTIPDSVTRIGNEAFRGTQLTSITIPGSVTAIGNNAFAGNEISTITIGANVQIPSNAFDNSFAAFYNRNGRQAGTYTFANRQWTFTAAE